MDRNTFTGLFLIMVILGASVFFMKPNEAEIKKEREKNTIDSLKRVNASKPAQQAAPAAVVATPQTPDSNALKGPFGGNIAGTVQTSVLQNDKLKLTLSNLGGKIKAVEVLKEHTYGGKPLILFNDNKFGLNLNLNGKTLNTNDLYFTVAESSASKVAMRANYSANQYVEFVYELKSGSSNVAFNINLNGLNQVVQGNTINLNWEATLLEQEKSAKKEQEHAAPYFKYVEKSPDNLSKGKDEKVELKEGKVEWFSFKQQFYSAVLIPQIPFAKGDLEVKVSTKAGEIKWYAANMQLAFNQQAAQNYAMKFYFGNNKFENLKAQGQEIEKQVDMGYWPLKYINRFIVLPVFQLLESFGWGYGVIILVLTVLLKLAMSPLTYKSYISMAKMRILKPEMDEIKAKVGEDNATIITTRIPQTYTRRWALIRLEAVYQCSYNYLL
jgi:YidC/Oxa1 family membrane protein insertase